MHSTATSIEVGKSTVRFFDESSRAIPIYPGEDITIIIISATGRIDKRIKCKAKDSIAGGIGSIDLAAACQIEQTAHDGHIYIEISGENRRNIEGWIEIGQSKYRTIINPIEKCNSDENHNHPRKNKENKAARSRDAAGQSIGSQITC